MALCSPHTIVKHPCEFLTWALEYDNEANQPAEAGDKILPDSPLENSPVENNRHLLGTSPRSLRPRYKFAL